MSLKAQAQIAVMLLSRLPAGRVGGDAPRMGDTVWAWPLVGAVLGALGALVLLALAALGVPALVAGAGALVIMALATGGLHEDGLADVADGFGGGATRARKLEIMRDSRVGSYGVLALVLCIGLKLSVFAAMTDPTGLALGLVALGAASRALMAVPLALLAPARADGLGSGAQTTPGQVLAALAVALGALILSFGLGGLVVALVMGAASLALTALARAQIGGQTGDVCGATQALTEVAGWIALSALYATS